jgi:hypothetical protein
MHDMATPVNPYESPRTFPVQGFTGRWGLPQYRVEHWLVAAPLLLALSLAWYDCLRALIACKFYFTAELSDGEPRLHVYPPFWDEAAWTVAIILYPILMAAIGVRAMRGRAARTPFERWLATVAVFMCFMPLLLHAIAMDPPLGALRRRWIELIAWTIGLGLLSGGIQTALWWNRRRVLYAIFWALHSYLAFGRRLDRVALGYIRPARR